jgi:shikimate kinase
MSNTTIQDLDIFEVIRSISRRNKRTQAKLLQEIEMLLDKRTPEYALLRKFILDELNSYTRFVVKEIFGDIEFLIK